MKKVYLFYLFDTEDRLNQKIYPAIEGLDILKGNNFNHVLYAWTPNKEIRNQFKNLRDMTKFREVSHYISKEDFERFCDENSETFLEERLITTKDTTKEKVITKKNIYILSTRKELDIIVDDKMSIMRDQLDCLIKPEIYLMEKYFSGIYKQILEFINFDEIMLFIFPLEEDTGIPFCMITEDSLAIYSHLYHNTYRKDIR